MLSKFVSASKKICKNTLFLRLFLHIFLLAETSFMSKLDLLGFFGVQVGSVHKLLIKLSQQAEKCVKTHCFLGSFYIFFCLLRQTLYVIWTILMRNLKFAKILNFQNWNPFSVFSNWDFRRCLGNSNWDVLSISAWNPMPHSFSTVATTIYCNLTNPHNSTQWLFLFETYTNYTSVNLQ